MEERMTDKKKYIQQLLISNPLREPVIQSVIQELGLPLGSHGLDAGCGIGLQALLLAEAVGPEGHVTGLDLCLEFIARAKDIVEQSGLSERISFKEGNLNNLPFDNDTFDWIWSADSAGYHAEDHLFLMKELTRVVRPGGTVSILFWSSQQLLPGYPLLEARLNATSAGIAPFVNGNKPESHIMRALGWFRDAGLEELRARTFVGDAHAPFSDEIRDALTILFPMRWNDAQPEVLQEDWEQYQRLCLPESPDFILNLPDYYAYFTYSLFHGRVVK